MSEEPQQTNPIDPEAQWQQSQRQIEEQRQSEMELQRSRDLEFQRYQEERQQEAERQEQQRRAEERQTQQRREAEERRQRQEEQREARQQKATEQKLEAVQPQPPEPALEVESVRNDRQSPPAQQPNPYSQTFNITANELVDERQPLRQVQEQMYREGIQDQLRASGQKQGLDRHDYYHMAFAAELDGAMDRAKAAGVNINKPEQVLKFIQKEEAQARTEGQTTDAPKRLLSDRYQEFTRRTKERDSLLRRGVPEKLVPSTQLRESHSEQQARFRQQFDQALDETQWRSEVNQRWQQKQSAKAAAQSSELSPARARLEQIRAANGIDPNQQPKQIQQKER